MKMMNLTIFHILLVNGIMGLLWIIPVEAQSLSNSVSRSVLFNKILLIVFLFLITFLLNGAIGYLLNWLKARRLLVSTAFLAKYPILQTLLWSAAVLFVFMVILPTNLYVWLILMGVGGLSIVLALRDVLRNVFGGIVILIERPFRVGDRIQVGQYIGEVTRIGLHSIQLLTTTSSFISIPHAKVINDPIQRLNLSSNSKDMQVKMVLSLPINMNLNEVYRIAYEAILTSRYTFCRSPITIYFKENNTSHQMIQMIMVASVFNAKYEMFFRNNIFDTIKRNLNVEAGEVVWCG